MLKVMPFRLKNAGVMYQRLVNQMFNKQIGRKMEVYVDDMLVKAKKQKLTLTTFRRCLILCEDTE